MNVNKSLGIKNWALIFTFASIIGLLNFSIVNTANLASGDLKPFYYPLIWEMTGAYSGFLLLPGILWLINLFPICRQNLVKHLFIHLAGSVVYGFFHTILMKFSRIFIYSLFGLGFYDYGDMRYRFLMEYHKQFIWYILVLATYHSIVYYQTNKERELKTAELELKASQLDNQLTQVQLQALKAQINPHFLFNTLNMISSLMYEDVKAADKMLVKLSNFLRMTLEKGNSQKILLSQELEFVTNYLDIMKARFPDKLDVKIDVEANLQTALVPSMLLQPLVENSIKHNDLSDKDKYKITIKAYREQGKLILCVLDNGRGIKDKEQDIFQQGIGLSNIQTRLKQLYAGKHKLNIANKANSGLEVLIELPLENIQEEVKELSVVK
ncbi:MAG: histidine kinase [Blastocatellia bacterium]